VQDSAACVTFSTYAVTLGPRYEHDESPLIVGVGFVAGVNPRFGAGGAEFNAQVSVGFFSKNILVGAIQTSSFLQNSTTVRFIPRTACDRNPVP